MDRIALEARLKDGLFLSSMMGWTNGAYCARNARGTCMVQLGALIADAEDRSHEARHLLPAAEEDMAEALRGEVDAIRKVHGDLPIALNCAVGDLPSGLSAARAFAAAGGDIFELNCHGGYQKLLSRGLLRAMALPPARTMLLEWLDALSSLDVPVVVKFNAAAGDGVDFTELLDEVRNVHGLFGVHLNVRGQGGSPDVHLVRRVRGSVPGVLLCSGSVTTTWNVRKLLESGADCVGIAQGILDDPGIIVRLAAELRRAAGA
jgi:tRNA-dihydrouridine synthase